MNSLRTLDLSAVFLISQRHIAHEGQQIKPGDLVIPVISGQEVQVHLPVELINCFSGAAYGIGIICKNSKKNEIW